MYEPLDESLDQATEVWGWDRNAKLMSNGLVTAMQNFNQIIHFISTKQSDLSIYLNLILNVIQSFSIFLVTRLKTPDITTKFLTLFCVWYYFSILD